MQPREFDRVWFLARLKERHMTQAHFALVCKMDAGAVSLLFTGKRPLKLTEAQKFAQHLGVPLAEVLAHAGIEIEGARRIVKVLGIISHDGKVRMHAHGTEDDIDGPGDLPMNAYALVIRAHHTTFAALDRWVVYVSGIEQPPVDLLGQHALCAWADGQMRVGELRLGATRGTINLHAGTVEHENINAKWASRVLWLRPPAPAHEEFDMEGGA
jgi:transcriptional regulator with XRE-family HTH domain